MRRPAGLLDEVDGFDWRAFRIPPREARALDPQHRLLLEVAWEALEDAGIPFEEVVGTRAGVFVALMWNDYLRMHAGEQAAVNAYSATGNVFAFAPGRVSYTFDLHGPSVAVDGACAGSLASVHAACNSLWLGESELCLAGGVNLMLSSKPDDMLRAAGVLSPTGHCRTLDAQADGFVRGEGAGIVVLKPLSQVTPADRVYALIRGGAVMHNGHNEWIMAASAEGQQRTLSHAYDVAGVEPKDVDYVELHGTGLPKGDPIEASVVGAVIGQAAGRARPCAVGSVKSNIGHLDSAAGIAGIIKVALAMQHREIPPTINLGEINPDIDADAARDRATAGARAVARDRWCGVRRGHGDLDDGLERARGARRPGPRPPAGRGPGRQAPRASPVGVDAGGADAASERHARPARRATRRAERHRVHGLGAQDAPCPPSRRDRPRRHGAGRPPPSDPGRAGGGRGRGGRGQLGRARRGSRRDRRDSRGVPQATRSSAATRIR